ncbi:NAD-specific glutamate dehydrogenase [Segatella copri]|nr:NAD-specific glutamate dehydrogenase [Segatella copri]
MDGNLCLVISCCREYLALLARDSCIGIDELSHHTTHSLDTESQWSNVEQYDVTNTLFLVQNGTLDSCTYCNNLIWVNTLRRLLAEVVLNECLNGWDTA